MSSEPTRDVRTDPLPTPANSALVVIDERRVRATASNSRITRTAGNEKSTVSANASRVHRSARAPLPTASYATSIPNTSSGLLARRWKGWTRLN